MENCEVLNSALTADYLIVTFAISPVLIWISGHTNKKWESLHSQKKTKEATTTETLTV